MAESTLDKLSNLKFNSRAIQVETASDSLLGDSAYRGRGQGRGGRRHGAEEVRVGDSLDSKDLEVK